AYSPLPLLYFNETFRLLFCFLCIRSFEAPELRSAAWFTWDKGSYSILFCNTKSVYVTSCIVVLRFFEVVRQLVLRYLSARARQKDGRGNHVALYSHANLAVGLRDSTFPTLAGRADQTQYPPKTQEARLLVPETHGFYPTSLEREGRLAKQPFPTNLKLDHLLDPLLHPQAGSKSGVLDLLLSGLLPQTHHVPTKRPTTNPPVVTSSSPSEASTSDQTLPLITSPPVVPTASSSLTTANEEASDAIVSQNTGSTRPGYSSQDNNSSSSSEPASETPSAGETQATISTTSGGSVQESQSSSETTSAGETQATTSTTSGGSVEESQSSSETTSAGETQVTISTTSGGSVQQSQSSSETVSGEFTIDNTTD
ncbi:putative endo-1,3(4)-beta-glucanase 2, partial [Aspergillus udagawae]